MLNLFAKLFPKKISNTSEKQRLAVTYTERSFREGFSEERYAEYLDARENWFQNTPQIQKVEKKDDGI